MCNNKRKLLRRSSLKEERKSSNLKSHHTIRKTTNCHIYDKIYWIDYTENIYELFKISDLFCLTSEYEGLGLVLLESFTFSCHMSGLLPSQHRSWDLLERRGMLSPCLCDNE